MDVSKQLVWQWELEEDHPDYSDPRKHIEQLCQVLEFPSAHFYGEDPEDDSLEAKVKRLALDYRPVAEATIDALLAQQAAAAKPKKKPKPVK